MRARFEENLRRAVLSKDSVTASTLRLILAALKDRDIAARGKGRPDGIDDDEILAMLQTMIKQRKESIALYLKGNRQELAEAEQAEIAVIEGFLPEPMSAAETQAAIVGAIAELEASGLKDMGRVMALLRERHAGRMDFNQASGQVKTLLS